MQTISVTNHKDTDIKLTQSATQPKGGQKPIEYWRVDIRQFINEVKDEQTGRVYKEYCLGLETLAHLMDGMENVVDELQARMDINIRAAQLKQGKDVHTIEEKLGKIVEYIHNDFGHKRTTKVDEKLEELRKSDSDKANKLARLHAISLRLFTPSVVLTTEERAVLVEELKTLSA